jgi:2-dehydro-3-deoxygluconokinase
VTNRVLAIGECMVELAPVGDGLYRRGFAGDTYNFAWYLRRLLPADWQVGYGTWLGTDALSDELEAAIAGAGIDTAAIRRTGERTVGLYMIELRDGERSFTYWRSQSAARLLASDAAWLEAQLEGRPRALLRHHARRRRARASRNACSRRSPGHGRPARRSPSTPTCGRASGRIRRRCARPLMQAADVADIALPSFEDEHRYFGDATIDATLERYRARGARTVVVKNGADAIAAWDATDGDARLQPPRVAAVDTTAAGDSFNAGFFAARLRGASLYRTRSAPGRVSRPPSSGIRGRWCPRRVCTLMLLLPRRHADRRNRHPVGTCRSSSGRTSRFSAPAALRA